MLACGGCPSLDSYKRTGISTYVNALFTVNPFTVHYCVKVDIYVWLLIINKTRSRRQGLAGRRQSVAGRIQFLAVTGQRNKQAISCTSEDRIKSKYFIYIKCF